jgi:hypothetical protein
MQFNNDPTERDQVNISTVVLSQPYSGTIRHSEEPLVRDTWVDALVVSPSGPKRATILSEGSHQVLHEDCG